MLFRFLILVHVCMSFPLKCPEPAQWSIRARSHCPDPSKYFCLKNDLINGYSENCTIFDFLQPGRKNVLRGGLDADICSSERYQPWPIKFLTNVSTNCIFLKSVCNEEGQVVYDDGNRNTDATCRCDHTRGYNFFVKPRNPCFCVPSEEDCTCYLNMCHKLSPDNECINSKDIISINQCKPIIAGRNNNEGNQNDTEYIVIGKQASTLEEYTIEVAIFVTSILPVVICLSFLVLINIKTIFSRCFKEYTPRKLNIVESTDCSITFEWLIDVPDECLSYELDNRPRGTDDWSTKTFLSEDVLKVEDGRRMYKLQNLLPKTYYEFKMRSVYKNVKSRYSECKTKQTLTLAPRKFDIVESTHCSITFEWFIDVSDECLSYELDHRHQGTNDWSTWKFLSEDVLKREDGRRMYELPNLLPETFYDLKICSVDEDDVKSHYSESKTKQTLKLVLPAAINQSPEEDKIRFNKLMESSPTENRYFVRIMLVGKESVGKTCLLRRLLKEDISDVSSTDGVDIVVRRCKINTEDGKWKIGEVTDDDKMNRIKRAISPNERAKSTTANFRGLNLVKLRKIQKQDSSAHDDTSKIENNVPSMQLKHDVSDEKTTTADINGYQTKEGKIMCHNELSTTDNLDENIDNNESLSLVMPGDLISHVFTNSVRNTQSIHYALGELWDFAGQKEFYATHQAFLTSNAVYLVVADMNEDISKQGISQYFADFQDVGAYVDFWFESVHCHRTVDDPESEHFDPPIILVFTGKDKFDKEYISQRIEKLDQQLNKVLGDQSKHHHLRDKFYLSNTEDPDNVFRRLRTAIFDTARKMDNWGQAFPMKWILLEHLIEINKGQGKNFINFVDMTNMANHPDINILNEDDLLVFLRFQHNVGYIIFFENIRDLIILKPQWLADAFRCLVSDKVDTKLHHLSDYKLLKDQGKISKSLITKLFESKKGSQFLGQQGNLHQIMEKLDIIVKIDTNFYIMPSKMPASTFEDVCKNVGIRNTDCKRTSWLCLKFDFLPPSFFNHLSAWFIRNYKPCKLDSDSGSFALYRGICIFDIDSSGCVKILVTMSTDIIALQVVSFSKQKNVEDTCRDIYDNVKDVVEKIRKSYKVKISFKLHFKCSDGDYYKDTFVYETLKSEQEYYCPQHKTAHQSYLIYSPWMKNEVEKIQDDIAKISTSQDDLHQKNEPNKEDAFTHDQASVHTNLPVSVYLRRQLNIKKSKNETQKIHSCIKIGNALVFTDCQNKRLIICNSDGTFIHHIPLSYQPYYKTDVDSNTVAVSCSYDGIILIINISTRSVTNTINIRGYCWGIAYNDNNLYVFIGTNIVSEIIHVIDMTGKAIRTIPLISRSIIDITVDRDRLVYTDDTSIYCCSLNGKLIWKFENDKHQELNGVTTDDERNVYVTNEGTNTVLVVSGDGRHNREIITKLDGLNKPCGIYFDKIENVLLVCNYDDGKAFLFDVKNQHT